MNSLRDSESCEVMVHQVLRRLGTFNALFNTGVLYNHIVFRVVAGVTGAIAPETVAVVTMLEYTLNCLLEVPLGAVADRFGRVRATVIGLLCICLGLTSIYLALLIPDKTVSWSLIVLDGILLGIGKPLISGSFQAFYQDAIVKHAKEYPDLVEQAKSSFTRSLKFGRNYPVIGSLVALVTIYACSLSIGQVHAFIPGILIYAYVVIRITADLKFLGEEKFPPNLGDNKRMLLLMKSNRRAQFSTLLKLFLQLINSVISGYMILTLLRMATSLGENYFWSMFVVVSFSTGMALTIRGYLLGPLHEKLGRKTFIILALLVHLVNSSIIGFFVEGVTFPVLLGLVFTYNLFFYMAQQALNVSTIDILNSVVESKYRATALSLMNMPAFLAVGLYGLYLSTYRNGAPGVHEMFFTSAILAALGLGMTLLFFNTSEFSGKVD